jgi:hypothetical protein
MAQIAAASEVEAGRIMVLPSNGYATFVDGLDDKRRLAGRKPRGAGWRKIGAAPRGIEEGSQQD